MVKGTSRAEATSNSEKVKPIALAIVELRKSEDIRQAGRQLVSQSVSKFCSNFLKAFQVGLKLVWTKFYLINTAPLLYTVESKKKLTYHNSNYG